MTYAQERFTKASVALHYAEAGFEKTMREVSEILAGCSIDDVPNVLEQLKLEYEVLMEAKAELDRVKKYFCSEGETCHDS